MEASPDNVELCEGESMQIGIDAEACRSGTEIDVDQSEDHERIQFELSDDDKSTLEDAENEEGAFSKMAIGDNVDAWTCVVELGGSDTYRDIQAAQASGVIPTHYLPDVGVKSKSRVENVSVPEPRVESSPVAYNCNCGEAAPVPVASVPPEVEERIRTLCGNLVQMDDFVKRLEMIFNQSIGRIDDQLRSMTVYQKKNNNAITEAQAVIQALVAEVGEERVQQRMQDLHSQMQSRQYEAFGRDFQVYQGGGGRGKQGQCYTPYRERNNWDYQQAQSDNDQWRRRGRGGRRGGHF